MTNPANRRQKVIVLVVLTLICIGIGKNYLHQNNKSLDIMQEIASTANTQANNNTEANQGTESPMPTQAPMENGEYIEDENVLESTYYSYGSGCLFVTVEKEMASLDAEASAEDDKISDDTTSVATGNAVSTGSAVTQEMQNTGVISSLKLVKACLTEEEQQELISGEDKELRIIIRNMDVSEVDEKTFETMEDAIDTYTAEKEGFSFGDYISITIKKKNKKGKWKKIKNFYSDLDFYLDVPKDMQIDKAKYYFISLGEDKNSLVEDKDSYGKVMTVSVNRSSVYGLAYVFSAKENKSTASPAPTTEQSALAAFWDRLNNDKFCLWHWFDVSVLIIGITWILAINNKKIRTLFFVIQCIVCIALGFMGHCEFDWPFAIGVIVIMLLAFLWKGYCQRKA